MVDSSSRPDSIFRIFRGACAVVAVVAGLAGTVMLVAPERTDDYFSWPIGPPPLAALVGSFYLASAVTFAVLGLRADWAAARGICFGILAFTLPTLVATVRHRDLFNWGRWQAVAWIALFVGAPLAFSSFLYLLRGQVTNEPSPLPGWTRAILGLLGAVYAALAVGLLLGPGRLQNVSPFALPGLSGRFLGSWCAFLAVVAIFAMWRDRRHETTFPLMALLLCPVAALVAAVRSFDDLQPSSRRQPYLVLAVVLAALASAALAGWSRTPRSNSTGRR